MKIESCRDGWVARVDEVSLESGVSDDDWARIEEAWADHFCLVVSGQGDLSTAAHVAFLERFGPIIEERLPGDQHSYVTNAQGHGVDEMNEGYIWGELTPHMDFTYTPYPADVISLYAEEIPAGGTSTYFYNNAEPLGRMPRALRRRIKGRTIRCVHDLAVMPPDARPYLDPSASEGDLVQRHDWPLVREHPARAGLEVLACSLQQTAEILECADAGESRELLAVLFDEYLYKPANQYEHRWAVGDLVVWDNCALQHARDAISREAGLRVLRRVSTCRAGNGIEETVKFLNLGGASDAFGNT